MIQALVTEGGSDFLTIALFLFTIVVLGVVAYVFGFKPIQNSDADDQDVDKVAKEKPGKSKSKESGKDKKKAE